MKLDEHFVNRVAATVVIRDFSEKIFKVSKELKSSKDVKEFKETLFILKNLSRSNIKEIEQLLDS